LRLARYFGGSAALWLRLQIAYDLARAEAKLATRIAAEVTRPPRELRAGDRAARVGDGRRLFLPVLRPGGHRARQRDAVDPDLVADDHLDMARGGDHVDPLVGVARVDEDLLVLLVPAVDPVPIEGDEVLDRGNLVIRLGIAPHRVLRNLVADPDRPIGGRPLV